jgi:hypothetical protein
MANPEDFFVQFDPIHYEGPLVDAPLPLKIYKVNSYLVAPPEMIYSASSGKLAGSRMRSPRATS